jgi:ankyrin repeat protein
MASGVGGAAGAALLIRAAVRPDMVDDHGQTPLSFAARYGRCGAVDVLLKSGVKIGETDGHLEAGDRSYPTVLHQAARSMGNETGCMVSLLVARGASVSAVNAEGATPLHIAALTGNWRTVEALIKAGTRVDSMDALGRTALQHAASNRDAAVARILVEAGATVDAKNRDGWTALHAAADSGRPDTVAFLIEAGAAVSARDAKGDTPLHLAAFRGHAGLVRFADLWRWRDRCAE